MKPWVLKALLWSSAVLALAGAWTLYTQPDFMVQMADRVWSCF